MAGPETGWTVREVVRSRAGVAMLGVSAVLRAAYSAWAVLPAHDSLTYDGLAHSLLGGAYRIPSTDAPIKPPGYPLFLAALYGLAGEHHAVVYAAQHAVDLGTAVLVLGIAQRLALPKRSALLAFALALFDPFTAAYGTQILSETLSTFLVTFVIWLLLGMHGRASGRLYGRFAAIGALLSYAALCRASLAVLAPGLLLVLACLRRTPFAVWVRGASLATLAFLAVWAPWGIRNAERFHHLIPYQTSDLSPRPGYNRWTFTWVVGMLDIYKAYFDVPSDPPAHAYVDPTERDEVEELIRERDANSSPPSADRYGAIDERFSELADARIQSHPARYWLVLPLERAASMWFTRETTSLAQANVRMDQLRGAVTRRPLALAAKLALFALMPTLPTLMLVGCAVLLRQRQWGAMFAIATGFLLTVVPLFVMLTQPAFLVVMEPRYVVEAFPALSPAAGVGISSVVALLKRLKARLIGSPVAPSPPPPPAPAAASPSTAESSPRT